MEPIKKEKQGSLPTEKDELRNLLKGWKVAKEEAKKEGDKETQKKVEKGIKKVKRRLEKTT